MKSVFHCPESPTDTTDSPCEEKPAGKVTLNLQQMMPLVRPDSLRSVYKMAGDHWLNQVVKYR